MTVPVLLHPAPLHPVGLHLGPLHPVEQVLTVVLAFGPFVLLGVTIWLSRRRDARADGDASSADRADQAPER